MEKTIKVEYKSLSTEKQNALAEQIQKGDKSKYKELIESSHAYLQMFIKPYIRETYSFEDAYQDACIGMIKAINTWNPKGGATFISWSRNYMKTEIMKGTLQYYRISVPKDSLHYQALSGDKNVRLSDDTVNKISSIRFTLTGDMTDSDGKLYEIKDDRYSENEFEDKELVKLLNDCISKMKIRDDYREVFIHLNGLRDGEIKTLVATGKAFGISREMVRQINVKCMKMLRIMLKKRSVDETIIGEM